jgi:hypothetical protein
MVRLTLEWCSDPTQETPDVLMIRFNNVHVIKIRFKEPLKRSFNTCVLKRKVNAKEIPYKHASKLEDLQRDSRENENTPSAQGILLRRGLRQGHYALGKTQPTFH